MSGSEASDGAADATPAAGAIAPFWRRIPRLLRLPLLPAPLAHVLGGALLAALLGNAFFDRALPASAGSIMVLLAVFAVCALVPARFAQLALEHTASGYLDPRSYPPKARPSSSAPANALNELARPARLLLLALLVPLLIGAIGALLSAWIGRVALVAWALLLPAAIVGLALTDSLGEAFDPQRGMKTVRSMGGGAYVLLCLAFAALFLLCDWAGVNAVREATQAHLVPAPEGAGRHAGAVVVAHETASLGAFSALFFALSALAGYLLVFGAALLGYAMYQFNEALGVPVVGPGETRAAKPTSARAHARRQREALIGKMVAAGEVAEAINLLNADLAQRPTDSSLHARLHELLITEGSRPKIEAHATRYLELLMAAGNARDAFALWERTRAAFSDFMPREPAHWPVLANEALAADKPQAAADLIRGFDKRFPEHPGIPEAYLVGARVMLKGGHDAQAQRLLNYVVSKYSASPAAAEAKRYLARFSAPAP